MERLLAGLRLINSYIPYVYIVLCLILIIILIRHLLRLIKLYKRADLFDKRATLLVARMQKVKSDYQETITGYKNTFNTIIKALAIVNILRFLRKNKDAKAYERYERSKRRLFDHS